ncbi:MAG: M48 family metallopeptidase, partial [Planctomycetes bacterium]|nr:M48 family metallopeptidase [Planctomycetota bacterium]
MGLSRIFLSISLCAVVVFGGCYDEAPITGRKQLSLVSSSSLNSMALGEYNDFLKSNKLSNNAAEIERVKRVGTNIANAVDRYFNSKGKSELLSGYEWQFNLVEDKAQNAWCMPGGRVVVYTGILPVTKDDTGLAVVMSHEIAHAVAEHGKERMSQQLLVTLGGLALEQATSKQPDKTRS